MRIRQKLLFLILAPLCVAAIVLAVRHQAAALTLRHQAALQAAYLASTRAELRRHVELALHTVGHLYETGRVDDAVRRQARQALTTLEAGTGGYFFVYDQQGRDVLHPPRTEPGDEQSTEATEAGDAGQPGKDSPVRQLIERADKGGGYVRYAWRVPQDQPSVPRLAYVGSLPRWGWVVGSGVALDHIDGALAGINGELASYMERAMLLLTAVAAMAALVVVLPGWLARLGKRSRQGRMARRLRERIQIRHWTQAIGAHLEALLARLHGKPAPLLAAPAAFAGTSGQLNAHRANPGRGPNALQGELPATSPAPGLATALEQLCAQWRHASGAGLQVRFTREGDLGSLPELASAVLIRVAQQALAHIARQATATEVSLRLHGSASLVMLQVRDNGSGADTCEVALTAQAVQAVQAAQAAQAEQAAQAAETAEITETAAPARPREWGEDLRTMRAQLEAIGGALALDTSSAGTLLSAVVARTPQPSPR